MRIRLKVLGAVAMFASGSPSLAALPAGASAPDFQADATLGGKQFRFTLHDALAKGPVVLYFFPAAFTSGCSVEAHLFAEASDRFHALGAMVIGVSTDKIETLNRFSISACQSKFTVASVDGKVLSAYHVKLPILGRASRTSYVIAPSSKVVFQYAALNPSQHVQKTLGALKQWTELTPSRR